MKDAMWKVDRAYGQRFRDPRDENQLVLDISEEPDLSLLKRQLLAELKCGSTVSVADLKNFTLLRTIYKEPRATTAVMELENEMKVSVSWKKSHSESVVSLTLFAT